MKSSINPRQVVALLNQLTSLDPQAMNGLVKARTICNSKLAQHRTVQVQQHKNKVDYEVGLLGILNGVFGVFPSGKNKGRGPITAMIDDKTGRLTGFVTTGRL